MRRQPSPGYGSHDELYMEQNSPPRPPISPSQYGQSPPQARRILSSGSTSSIGTFPVADAQAAQTAEMYTNPKSLLESYRADIQNNFAEEHPRFNPANTARTNSSVLLDMSDSIQMHLLVETALEDAEGFEVLSHEEVDELKSLVGSLEQMRRHTQQNLAIQSKYRDAAINMGKLYDGEKHGIQRLSHGSHHSQQLEHAEERRHSERRCEELASELWNLEKRLMGPQMRLLKHTAGVLQLTHKGPRKGHKHTNSQNMPGSPESMYTYSNSRNSMDRDPKLNEDLFDDRHLYRTFDGLESFELDRHAPKKDSGVDSEEYKKLKEESEKSKQVIATTEAKLDDLSHRLRQVIIKATPQRDETYHRPPSASDDDSEAGKHIDSQLDYLEQTLHLVHEEQDLALKKQVQSELDMEAQIGNLNCEVRDLLLPFSKDMDEPPQMTGKSLQAQLLYFQSSINTVENELQRAQSQSAAMKAELIQAKSTRTLDLVPTDSPANILVVLEGLWDVIQSGEADEKQRKAKRRQQLIENGQDVSDEEEDIYADFVEPFSVSAFSAKVQRLYNEATRLKDQKEVLQRQIKQQRELNNKTDATRDREQAELQSELDAARALLGRAQEQAEELQLELQNITEKYNKTKIGPDAWLEDKTKLDEEAAELRDVLFDRDEEIQALEEQLKEVKNGKGNDTEETRKKLDQNEEMINQLGQALEGAQTKIKSFEDELEGAHKATQGSTAAMAQTGAHIDYLMNELEAAQKSAKEAKDNEAQLQAQITQLKEKEGMLKELLKSLAEHEQAVDNLHRALNEKEAALEKMTKSHGVNEDEVEKLTLLMHGKESVISGKTQENEKLQQALKSKEAELEETTMQLVQLQTEVTIAKAELDGAYGTRAERAADIAANPLVQKEIDDLLQSNIKLQEEIQAAKLGGGAKVEELKRELGETIEDYERMTKAALEWEKGREGMEKEIDRLRAEREELENKMSEARVQSLGIGSPGPGSPRESVRGLGERSTSTSVLKMEFKKMMRDTRAENAKALRVSCRTERASFL